MTQPQKHDSDSAKGAVEQEKPQPHADNPYTHGQLGHRDQNEDLKDNDTDFPEPGAGKNTPASTSSSRKHRLRRALRGQRYSPYGP